MMAVSVPGLAISEMSSRSCLPCLPLSTVYLTPCTSRPPVRVSASLRGSRVLLLNTRSTLPMVTTSPSVRIADPTRMPLTNVPLMLRSRISVPSGVNVSVACSREARTSGMTMSLSLARPIVTVPAVAADPAGPAVPDVRCERNFTNLVARFDTSPGLASMTVNSAGCGVLGEADPALTTVSSSGGGLGGGCAGGDGRGGGIALC